MEKFYKAILTIDGKEVTAWQCIVGDAASGYSETGFVDDTGAAIELPEVYEARIVDRKMRDKPE